MLHERLGEHIGAWLTRTPNPLLKSILRMNGKRVAAACVNKEPAENGDQIKVEDEVENGVEMRSEEE